MRGSGARLAIPSRVAQLAVRGRGARRNPSAQKRTVRTLAFWNRQPAAPAPVPAAPAPADLTTVVGLTISTLTIIMFLQGFITTKQEITNVKLDTISKDVVALSADVRAQQTQISVMQGKVDVLQGIVTGTPTPTKQK